jgi:polysaccharide export outer membrane protein
MRCVKSLVVTAAVVVVAGAVAPAFAQQASPSVKPTATPPAAAQPRAALQSAAPSDYVIGPEDVLQVSVWKNETLSRVVPVRPDGKISLPLLHDVQASGLTAMQLRDKISRALSEFMPNPEVSVIVTDVRSFRVSIMGEVQRPGVLLLKSSTTVLEAIAMAGGFRDFASPSKIMVVRKGANGQTEKIPFNYNRAIRAGEGENDIFLKTGDVIVVP